MHPYSQPSSLCLHHKHYYLNWHLKIVRPTKNLEYNYCYLPLASKTVQHRCGYQFDSWSCYLEERKTWQDRTERSRKPLFEQWQILEDPEIKRMQAMRPLKLFSSSTFCCVHTNNIYGAKEMHNQRLEGSMVRGQRQPIAQRQRYNRLLITDLATIWPS